MGLTKFNRHFSEDYEALKNSQQMSEKSTPRKLNQHLKNGILTMISRLSNLQQLPEQMRNTIILPKDARISTLIIVEHHKMVLHLGPETTLRNITLKYWILGGRQQIRKAIKSYAANPCKHPNLQEEKQQIPNLPTARITPAIF